jgi:hypothetical protein
MPGASQVFVVGRYSRTHDSAASLLIDSGHEVFIPKIALEVKEPSGLFSPPANIDRLGCNRPRPKPPNVASEIK